MPPNFPGFFAARANGEELRRLGLLRLHIKKSSFMNVMPIISSILITGLPSAVHEDEGAAFGSVPGERGKQKL